MPNVRLFSFPSLITLLSLTTVAKGFSLEGFASPEELIKTNASKIEFTYTAASLNQITEASFKSSQKAQLFSGARNLEAIAGNERYLLTFSGLLLIPRSADEVAAAMNPLSEPLTPPMTQFKIVNTNKNNYLLEYLYQSQTLTKTPLKDLQLDCEGQFSIQSSAPHQYIAQNKLQNCVDPDKALWTESSLQHMHIYEVSPGKTAVLINNSSIIIRNKVLFVRPPLAAIKSKAEESSTAALRFIMTKKLNLTGIDIVTTKETLP